MYNREKIRIMSLMAIYDKKDFQRDAKAGQYFRHDFIYKKNMRMRFFLGIGCIILLFFYAMYLMAIEEADIFALDFQAEGMRVLFVALLIMVSYSFLGTIIYTREYIKSEKRVDAYFDLMRQLHDYKHQETIPMYDAPDHEDSAEYDAFEPYRPQSAADLEYKYPTEESKNHTQDIDY